MAAGASALFMLLPALCGAPATFRHDIMQLFSSLVNSNAVLYGSVR